MNIQIFGTKKSFDSKKAERFFKERGIKYQFVDMKEKGLSKGEFNSVCQAVGGYEKLIDQECKDKDLLALITYLAEEDKAEKILENQKVIKTPIVRNGKQATVGYQPMCGRIGNRCIWRVREDDILQPRRPIPATTPAERNPDFTGINTKSI